jgi:hypothetical protein
MDSQWTGPVPNELWQIIFAHGDQKEFHEISLVCRRLHHLVEPYLYREFNWIPDPKDPLPPMLFAGESGTAEKGAKNTPFKLLQTIANRPELALYFKHAKLFAVSKDVGAFWNKTEAYRNILAANKILPWFQNIQNPFDGHKREWTTLFIAGRQDIVVGLLLTLLTNLSSVELRVRYGSTEDNLVFEGLYTGCLKNQNFKWRPIKSITISLDDYTEPDWTSKSSTNSAYGMDKQLLKLLKFPQLEQLSVSHLNNGFLALKLASVGAEHPLMGRNLKKLKLPNCRLWEFQLKALLDYTFNLEELECEMQYNLQDFGDLCLGNELLDALSKVAGTLRKLKLRLQIHSDEYLHPYNGVHTTMGSMKHFRHLRYEPFSL